MKIGLLSSMYPKIDVCSHEQLWGQTPFWLLLTFCTLSRIANDNFPHSHSINDAYNIIIYELTISYRTQSDVAHIWQMFEEVDIVCFLTCSLSMRKIKRFSCKFIVTKSNSIILIDFDDDFRNILSNSQALNCAIPHLNIFFIPFLRKEHWGFMIKLFKSFCRDSNNFLVIQMHAFENMTARNMSETRKIAMITKYLVLRWEFQVLLRFCAMFMIHVTTLGNLCATKGLPMHLCVPLGVALDIPSFQSQAQDEVTVMISYAEP